MDHIFRDSLQKDMFRYIDDIVIHTKTVEEHRIIPRRSSPSSVKKTLRQPENASDVLRSSYLASLYQKDRSGWILSKESGCRLAKPNKKKDFNSF